MLKLAGREGDGAIINWLSADDVKTVVPHVGADKEIVARIFVFPVDDAGMARAVGKRAIASYLTVPVYAAFHEWLGRGDELADLWRLWKEGDRKAAADSIPDHVVDELLVWGKPEACREHIQRYIDNGVTTPAPALFCGPDQLRGGARGAQALTPVVRGDRRSRGGFELDVVVADVREAQERRACARPTSRDRSRRGAARTAPRSARRGGCCAGPRPPVIEREHLTVRRRVAVGCLPSR